MLRCRPRGALGGLLGLLITHTPFSISAAVGFASALGVGTLGGLVFLNAIRRAQRAGEPLWIAIRIGATEEDRFQRDWRAGTATAGSRCGWGHAHDNCGSVVPTAGAGEFGPWGSARGSQALVRTQGSRKLIAVVVAVSKPNLIVKERTCWTDCFNLRT